MTKSQAEFQRRIREMGCICCWLMGYQGTECDIHHILSGGRRMGEDYVLGLCPGHHRTKEPGKQARHIHKSTFVAAYGTEMYLLEKTKALLGRRVAA